MAINTPSDSGDAHIDSLESAITSNLDETTDGSEQPVQLDATTDGSQPIAHVNAALEATVLPDEQGKTTTSISLNQPKVTKVEKLDVTKIFEQVAHMKLWLAELFSTFKDFKAIEPLLQKEVKHDTPLVLFKECLRYMAHSKELLQEFGSIDNVALYIKNGLQKNTLTTVTSVTETGEQNNLYVLKILGQGGFAKVYLTVNTGIITATKVILDSASEMARQRFEIEQRALKLLKGAPGFIDVHSTGTTVDGAPFIEMKYMPYGDLDGLIDEEYKEDSQYQRQGVCMFEQVAGSLDHIHATGTLHRDIKPANLLLSEHGDIVVTDMGLTLLEGSHEMTNTQQKIMGTMAYIAPEGSGKSATVKTDVFALGVSMYKYFSGKHPITTRLDDDGHEEDIIVYDTAAVPNEQIRTLIEQMIEEDPANRPTMQEAQMALHAVMSNTPLFELDQKSYYKRQINSKQRITPDTNTREGLVRYLHNASVQIELEDPTRQSIGDNNSTDFSVSDESKTTPEVARVANEYLIDVAFEELEHGALKGRSAVARIKAHAKTNKKLAAAVLALGIGTVGGGTVTWINRSAYNNTVSAVKSDMATLASIFNRKASNPPSQQSLVLAKASLNANLQKLSESEQADFITSLRSNVINNDFILEFNGNTLVTLTTKSSAAEKDLLEEAATNFALLKSNVESLDLVDTSKMQTVLITMKDLFFYEGDTAIQQKIQALLPKAVSEDYTVAVQAGIVTISHNKESAALAEVNTAFSALHTTLQTADSANMVTVQTALQTVNGLLQNWDYRPATTQKVVQTQVDNLPNWIKSTVTTSGIELANKTSTLQDGTEVIAWNKGEVHLKDGHISGFKVGDQLISTPIFARYYNEGNNEDFYNFAILENDIAKFVTECMKGVKRKTGKPGYAYNAFMMKEEDVTLACCKDIDGILVVDHKEGSVYSISKLNDYDSFIDRLITKIQSKNIESYTCSFDKIKMDKTQRVISLICRLKGFPIMNMDFEGNYPDFVDDNYVMPIQVQPNRMIRKSTESK